MEAILLAGGKAERLGAAAGGRPKALVPVGGRPLVAYAVEALAAAGVERAIVSCAAGKEALFAEELEGLGSEIVPVGEPEPLGRGGGLRYAARARQEDGDVFAVNADELLDLDFAALLARHRETGAAATITVVPLRSQLGVVDLDGEDVVTGFREAPRLPFWASCGVYVLSEEALARLPELVSKGRLRAFRHEGVWLTVNTPKDLRAAEAYVNSNPGGLTRVHSPR
jgi:NDP-sugar pyrophosphorylase family protein